MYQYLNNQPMMIYGDGNQTRAFSYIDDCLKPFWNAAIKKEASKEIINIGGIEEISINKACDTLIEVIGSGNKIYKEARHEVKHAIPTWEKSINILEYEYKTDLKQGLTEMWNWAKRQPKRDRYEWSSYELDTGIYSFWK
jgi:UDP-glucose 4-epimerase